MRNMFAVQHALHNGSYGRTARLIVSFVMLAALPLALGSAGPGAALANQGHDTCAEPNDEYQQACELPAGVTVSGSLGAGDDVDAYRIEMLNFHARIRLVLGGGHPAYRLSLVDWNGEVLNTSAEGAPTALEHVVGPPGSYYVFVHAAPGQAEPPAPYHLSLSTTYPTGATVRPLYSSAFSTDGVASCTATRGPAATTCRQEGGRFTIEIESGSTADAPSAAWLWVGPRVDDFTFTVDSRLIKDARNGAIQIDVRSQGYDDGYGVALVPREGLVVASKTVAGQTTQLASTSRPDLATRSGVNRITVTAVKAAIFVGLNGQEVLTFSDAAFGSGHVGFFAYTFDDPFIARIDNVLITSPAMHPCPPAADGTAPSAPCPP